MQAGDTVLVHAAGSGVGLAAVQLATAAGAKVYATAGSAHKIETAQRLGAVGGVNRHDHAQWKDAVVALVDGKKGFDVILDCVGPAYASQNAEVLAQDGRWVLYGQLGGGAGGGGEIAPLMSTLLRKRGQLLASTLRSRSLDYRRQLVQRFAVEALPRLISGEFRYGDTCGCGGDGKW